MNSVRHRFFFTFTVLLLLILLGGAFVVVSSTVAEVSREIQAALKERKSEGIAPREALMRVPLPEGVKVEIGDSHDGIPIVGWEVSRGGIRLASPLWDSGDTLLVSVSLKEAFLLFFKQSWWAILAGVTEVLVLLFTLDRWVLQPLRGLLQFLASGTLEERGWVDWTREDEIGELARQVKRMHRVALASIEEINNLKKVEEAILESIGDAVVAVDMEGRIMFFNRAAEALTGYTASESLGRPFGEILAMTREPKDSSRALRSPGISTLTTRDGRAVPVRERVRLIEDGSGTVTGCLILLRDMTHEEEFERAKSEFVGIASHELRTPLSAMRWSLEMVLESGRETIPPQHYQFVSLAYESTLRMIDLVEELLDVSRIEQGRLTLEPVEVSIEGLTEELVKECLPLANQRQIHLEWHKRTSPIPKVLVDRRRMRQVIENLLINGIKYTPEGGKVSVELGVEDGHVVLEVRDTGIGIPLPQQPYLFTKFFRGSNAVKSGIEGTGLGLFIAKHIVEASGGTIGFTSQEGHGSTFWVRLPALEVERNRPLSLQSALSEGGSASGSG
ncbi:MAG: ATP-binding protein [Armatimonadota bacterium]|nr:ATP-binding protein [Armatimonadota bacterium]MDR5702906.1 ATP-binding protein [Armatimonadota bacterium]